MTALESCRLFEGLPGADRQRLAAAARTVRVAAGQAVFRAGDPGDGLYLIEAGAVQISVQIAGAGERVVARMEAGDFFGEMALVDSGARSASALADSDTHLRFIPRAELLRSFEVFPRLHVNLLREFSVRMRQVNQRYVEETLQAERLALVGRFARTIVHDFKNPLNLVNLSADAIAMPAASADMRQCACARIHRQVERMTNMISELLEFTRGGAATLPQSAFNYATVIQPVLGELTDEIAAREVTLETEPIPSVHVKLDPARLPRVFYNLVHNAADEMPDGGCVHVSFGVAAGTLTTRVTDTGPGIDPEIAARLFEPFATHGKSQGTGLGLSICRRIVEDHGGRIAARNQPAGGAVFEFTLPLATQP